jgi:hypothetical protein
VVGGSFRPEYDRVPGTTSPGCLPPGARAHRLPHRRCGDAPDQPQRLHAQPPADDRGVLPDQGPGHRLAAGEYFAEQLNDFDLAANNGGWQWAASTGCDAQPWFRIFNPVTQSEKFDPDGAFIRRLPELAKVPDKYIHAPWTLPPIDQKLAGCVIGRITRAGRGPRQGAGAHLARFGW